MLILLRLIGLANCNTRVNMFFTFIIFLLSSLLWGLELGKVYLFFYAFTVEAFSFLLNINYLPCLSLLICMQPNLTSMKQPVLLERSIRYIVGEI